MEITESKIDKKLEKEIERVPLTDAQRTFGQMGYDMRYLEKDYLRQPEEGLEAKSYY